MSKLILYLLEASASLAILYALYLLLLRKETFFNLNRFFLLAILAFSFLIPLLSIELVLPGSNIINQPIQDLSEMRLSYHDILAGMELSKTDAGGDKEYSFLDYALMAAFIIYAIGFIAQLFRFVWTYLWIQRIKKSNLKEEIQGITVVKVAQPISPFSFLNAVFVSEELVHSDEFAQILAHEKAHIQEKHSIDLLIVQLLATVLWFNPVVWLLIKSLKTTHEYIADKKMINQGYSLVEYQSLLLRQMISNNSYGLVHNFNLSFIKQRITMMKIEKSGWAGKIKLTLTLTIAALISLSAIQTNATIHKREKDKSLVPSEAAEQEMLFYLDGKLISIKDGLSYDVMQQDSFQGNLECVASNSFYEELKNKNINLEFTLVREKRAVAQIRSKEFSKQNTVEVISLLNRAQTSDMLVIIVKDVDSKKALIKAWSIPVK